ncbi:hypothetical protein, variant [Cladophialophora immunda]|uniref:Uncharacterized protein n=1 Tax=Cladophialophora immunda TaxID=569365 RepID=A0A0D2CCR1_9EURO|nr:hypothetical protein, variant [Cladophialophora immunda]KIW28868.1 hypothetical protein, variant [Cladophialophora immunda]
MGSLSRVEVVLGPSLPLIMAITRADQHRQDIGTSRQLRSGTRLTITPNGNSLLSGRAVKSRLPPTSIKQRKRVQRRSKRSGQPNQLRDSRADDFRNLSSDAPELNEEEGFACGVSGAGDHLHENSLISYCDASNLPDEVPLALSSPTHDQPPAGIDARYLAMGSRKEEVVSDPVSLQESLPFSLEDAGLPHDEFWEITAAYDVRYCADHEEIEYLLGTVNRWISPDDFDVSKAESLLEEKLQKFKVQKTEGTLESFDPHLPRCQAGCSDTLYSHIYHVVDKHKHNGKVWYLGEWLACWTPESNIGDLSWIPESLAVNGKSQRYRCSARLKENLESRKKNYERMASVVNHDC